MGKALKSPPVYFTVAQLRFNPILQLGEYLPAIQEAFRRARYSDFLEHPTQVIKITQNDGKTRSGREAALLVRQCRANA